MLFSRVKIYDVFARKLAWYFIGFYIVKPFIPSDQSKSSSFLETSFHKKGFALGLVLRVRVFGTRKWPIENILRAVDHECLDFHSLNSTSNFSAKIVGRYVRSSGRHELGLFGDQILARRQKCSQSSTSRYFS